MKDYTFIVEVYFRRYNPIPMREKNILGIEGFKEIIYDCCEKCKKYSNVVIALFLSMELKTKAVSSG